MTDIRNINKIVSVLNACDSYECVSGKVELGELIEMWVHLRLSTPGRGGTAKQEDVSIKLCDSPDNRLIIALKCLFSEGSIPKTKFMKRLLDYYISLKTVN